MSTKGHSRQDRTNSTADLCPALPDSHPVTEKKKKKKLGLFKKKKSNTAASDAKENVENASNCENYEDEITSATPSCLTETQSVVSSAATNTDAQSEVGSQTKEKKKRSLSFWKKKKTSVTAKEPSQPEFDPDYAEPIYPDDDPETVKKKKSFWRRSGGTGPKSIGSPYNFVHKSHVDFDYQWTLQNPKETFDMLDLLGTGTFGTVYKACHHDTGFTLAVKVINIKGEEGLEDVQKEINILKRLSHPNIVSYYGCCNVSKQELWILMEYCNVGSVRDFMDMWPEPLNEDQIATILAHTIAGLAYLHDNKIAHRDIKAANILLDGQGRSKIADFGVAGQLSRSINKMHDFVGTVLFMAPEMLKDRATYDLSADIWALGITSLELAEQGYVPYSNERIMTAIRKIANNPPPTFADPSKWSSQFRDFLTCCLQKDPKKRPKARMLLMHPFILSHRAEIFHSGIVPPSNRSSPSSTSPQGQFLKHNSTSSSSKILERSSQDHTHSNLSTSTHGIPTAGSKESTIEAMKQPLLPKAAVEDNEEPTRKCCCIIL
eukprot:TRINITY_DN4202_c0_g1_i2.p1 TRINITY_DN4202_c0_g1~~TRINITY_DN4202_c0_g1_i2.p1  ORF type:complete len:548 (-),score=110.14 TRINITY_DN4202_c0_g1_i2:6-1649(-)